MMWQTSTQLHITCYPLLYLYIYIQEHVCVCVGGEVTKPRFTQYFRGSLSGLTIRPGKIESQKVISCLQACKEGLDINSLESLDKNIKVHTHIHTHHNKETPEGGKFTEEDCCRKSNFGSSKLWISIKVNIPVILHKHMSAHTTIQKCFEYTIYIIFISFLIQLLAQHWNTVITIGANSGDCQALSLISSRYLPMHCIVMSNKLPKSLDGNLFIKLKHNGCFSQQNGQICDKKSASK